LFYTIYLNSFIQFVFRSMKEVYFDLIYILVKFKQTGVDKNCHNQFMLAAHTFFYQKVISGALSC